MFYLFICNLFPSGRSKGASLWNIVPNLLLFWICLLMGWIQTFVARFCIWLFWLCIDSSHISQDGYVPYHSARIELCQAASIDNSRKGKLFLDMLNDCLDQIRAPSSEQRVFMRCDVNFDTSAYGKNLNTIIGRAAHIEFLESDFFARFIMWSFPELFRWVSQRIGLQYCPPDVVFSRVI